MIKSIYLVHANVFCIFYSNMWQQFLDRGSFVLFSSEYPVQPISILFWRHCCHVLPAFKTNIADTAWLLCELLDFVHITDVTYIFVCVHYDINIQHKKRLIHISHMRQRSLTKQLTQKGPSCHFKAYMPPRCKTNDFKC